MDTGWIGYTHQTSRSSSQAQGHETLKHFTPTLHSYWVNMTWRTFRPFHLQPVGRRWPRLHTKMEHQAFPKALSIPANVSSLTTMNPLRSKQSHTGAYCSPFSFFVLQSRSGVTATPQTNVRRDNEEGVMWEMIVVLTPPFHVLIWPFHSVGQEGTILAKGCNMYICDPDPVS